MIENLKKYKNIDEFDLSGVYILWKQNCPVYIGATEFLVTRIKRHKIKYDTFSFIPVLNEDERGRLENELIKQYCPIYNAVHYKTVIHHGTSYKNRNIRYKAIQEILKDFSIPPSCRVLRDILLRKYGIIVSHTQCNTDLKKFYTI